METELTEEQEERIRINRERALAILKKRQADEAALACDEGVSSKKRASEQTGESASKILKGEDENGAKVGGKDTEEKKDQQEDEILEDFEVGASPTITKKEAMQMYCLPEGTLAVCTYVEKENPHRKGWSAMKLYHRAEIRRRARERFGGMEGLIAERKKREMKRFKNTMEKAKDVFKKK